MKFYGVLKAEMEVIQQQMVETKKNENANEQKEVRRLSRELSLLLGCLEMHLVKEG